MPSVYDPLLSRIRVAALVGPTACGKTDLSIELAGRLGAQIISCDSRQIYRGMDIGTAKPSVRQLSAVPHHLIDILEPDEAYSAWRFATEALQIIRTAARAGHPVMITGGTGLYLKRLAEGIGPQVPANEALRAEYEKKVRSEGPETIFAELQRVDPATASTLHPHDTKRIIRALQVWHDTGVPFSAQVANHRSPDDIDIVPIVLTLPRAMLYERINRRVDDMVDRGLWDEFLALRARGFKATDPGMQCVGYQELFAVEETTTDLHRACELIRQHTRNYAKRQLTWLRHQVGGAEIFDMSTGDAGTRVWEHVRRLYAV